MSNRSTDDTLHKLDALISRRQSSGLAPSRRPVKILSPNIPVLTDTVDNTLPTRATVVPLRQDEVINPVSLPDLAHTTALEPTIALSESLLDSIHDVEPSLPATTTLTLPPETEPHLAAAPATARPRQNLANRTLPPPSTGEALESDLSEAAANLALALRQAGVNAPTPAPLILPPTDRQEPGLVEDFDFPDLTDDGLEAHTPPTLRDTSRAAPSNPPANPVVLSSPPAPSPVALPTPEALLEVVMAEVLPLVDVEVEKHLRTCILPKLRDFYQQLLDDTVAHVQDELQAHIEMRLHAHLNPR